MSATGFAGVEVQRRHVQRERDLAELPGHYRGKVTQHRLR
jgi:hypothetical protein